MELNLIKVTNKKTGQLRYYAINDKHYDAMLGTGGSNFDLEYEWDWLGDVDICEDSLETKGYFYKDDPQCQ